MLRKILIVYLATLMAGLAAAGYGVSVYLSRQMEHTVTQRLLSDLELLRAGYAQQPPDWTRLALDAARLDARLTVVAPDGAVLADSLGNAQALDNHNNRPEIIAARAQGRGHSVRFSNTMGEEMLYAAMPLKEGDGRGVVLRLGMPGRAVGAMQATLRETLIAVLSVVGLLAGAVGWLMIRSEMKPLYELTEVTEAIGRGEVERKAPLELRGEMGMLAGAINRMEDELSARVKALRHEKATLETVLAGLREGVIAIAADGKVSHLNQAACDFFDMREDAVGRDFLEVLRLEALIGAVSEASRSGRGRTVRFQQRARTLGCRVDPVPGGLLLVARDVTEEVKYETLRKEFVGNVSHELRTPLAIIKGFVETLSADEFAKSPQVRLFLEKVRKNVDQLGNLVDDLLVLSKLESELDAPQLQPMKVEGVVKQTLADLESLVQQKEHAVALEIAPELPEILGDAELLRRALKNLLENAIKYTPARGKITVRAQCAKDCIEIEVADNGLGIAKEHLPRLFERFYRVDKSRSRDVGGTGLGLSIVKHVAQILGGTVAVRSEEGRGSVFTLRIPVKQ